MAKARFIVINPHSTLSVGDYERSQTGQSRSLLSTINLDISDGLAILGRKKPINVDISTMTLAALDLEDVPARTLADRLFDQLRQAIVEGEIPAGSKISEPALAARYGVSRGSLREALQRLEAIKLIERRANVGARVVQLSSIELLEIYLVREGLEAMAARLAAERMSDAAIADLRALLEHHGRELARDDWQRYFQQEGDLDFHFRIARGSGNRRLIEILCNDLYHLTRLYRCQFGMRSHRTREALHEHELIVEAIAARDGELAEWMMRRHIRASRQVTEQQLTLVEAGLQAPATSDRQIRRSRQMSTTPSASSS